VFLSLFSLLPSDAAAMEKDQCREASLCGKVAADEEGGLVGDSFLQHASRQLHNESSKEAASTGMDNQLFPQGF